MSRLVLTALLVFLIIGLILFITHSCESMYVPAMPAALPNRGPRPTEFGTTSCCGLTYSSRQLVALRPSIDKLIVLHRQTSCSAVRLAGCHKPRCSCCRGTRAGRSRRRRRHACWLPQCLPNTFTLAGFSHDHRATHEITDVNIGLLSPTSAVSEVTAARSVSSLSFQLSAKSAHSPEVTFQSSSAAVQAHLTVSPGTGIEQLSQTSSLSSDDVQLSLSSSVDLLSPASMHSLLSQPDDVNVSSAFSPAATDSSQTTPSQSPVNPVRARPAKPRNPRPTGTKRIIFPTVLNTNLRGAFCQKMDELK